MRVYSAVGNATNTASATLPMWNITGGTTVQAKIAYLNNGSDATPAENAGKYVINRTTTTGTGTSTFTPISLSPTNTVASLMTVNLAYTATGPTVTANAVAHQWAQNMRATYQWWANPGFELVTLNTATSGFCCLPTVTTTAVNMVFTITWDE